MDEHSILNDLMRQGKARLFPSLTDPNWLVLRERRRIFERWLAQLPSKDLKVLDVGGRIQPYRILIADRIRQYIAVDLRLTALVDVIGNAEHLPLRAAHFDLVICTQMLEYVPEPASAVAEIFRVLKPGGMFLLSVPSAAPDAGQERWRLLPAGLRSLLTSFQRVEVVPEGSSVAGLFRTVNVCLDIFARYATVRLLYRHSFCPILNLSGALAEKLSGGRNQQFSVNYSVLAKK